MLSPTRELACQIAAEGGALCTFHKLTIVTVYGGTNINTDKQRLKSRVDILVATPGRLIDHLENTPNFAPRLISNLRVLIMDEADQLLEMGFRNEIKKILAFLPDKSRRQTLLFSATVPNTVKEIAKESLRRDYSFVDTVGEEEDQTHAHVSQFYSVVPLETQVSALVSILYSAAQTPNFKVIVFFTTARVTQLMSMLFNHIGLSVLEIHSRKSQAQRTKTSDEFRAATNVILFSSDVSARGMGKT